MVAQATAHTLLVWQQGQETLIWGNVTLDGSEKAPSLELGNYPPPPKKRHCWGRELSSLPLSLSPSEKSIFESWQRGLGCDWHLCVLHTFVKENEGF